MGRIRIPIVSDTGGTAGDTGKNINGTIKTIQWHVTTADTGADLSIATNPRQTDTGQAVTIYTAAPAALGGDFKVALDTGLAFVAGESVRVKFSNSTTLDGTLYIAYEESQKP